MLYYQDIDLLSHPFISSTNKDFYHFVLLSAQIRHNKNINGLHSSYLDFVNGLSLEEKKLTFNITITIMIELNNSNIL